MFNDHERDVGSQAEVGTGLELTERQRYWLGHVRAWQGAGGPMKAYAEAHGLEVKEFYHWKRWLGEKGLLSGVVVAPPLFQKVVVELPRSSPPSEPVCLVELTNGVRIALSGPLNATVLGVVFKAAGALP